MEVNKILNFTVNASVSSDDVCYTCQTTGTITQTLRVGNFEHIKCSIIPELSPFLIFLFLIAKVRRITFARRDRFEKYDFSKFSKKDIP